MLAAVAALIGFQKPALRLLTLRRRFGPSDWLVPGPVARGCGWPYGRKRLDCGGCMRVSRYLSRRAEIDQSGCVLLYKSGLMRLWSAFCAGIAFYLSLPLE